MARKFFCAACYWAGAKIARFSMSKVTPNKQDGLRRRGEFPGNVVEERQLGSSHKSVRLVVAGLGGQAFAGARSGQFVQVACRDLANTRASEPLLRRPLSIAGSGSTGGVMGRPVPWRMSRLRLSTG